MKLCIPFNAKLFTAALLFALAAPSLHIKPALATQPQKETALKTYNYKELYSRLGYTDGFFGASEDAVFAIKTYAEIEDPFYTEINGYLRYHPADYDWYGTSPGDAQKIVELIDGIFAKVPPLPEDLLMFRGLTLDFRGNKPYAPGEEFTEKAYSSTSASFKIAEKFASGYGETKSSGAIMVMYSEIPALKGILINQGEDEILLPRSLKFKVMAGVTKNNYGLYLVQICPETCKQQPSDAAKKLWKNFIKRNKQ